LEARNVRLAAFWIHSQRVAVNQKMKVLLIDFAKRMLVHLAVQALVRHLAVRLVA
jgi:hypothetical protein